MLIRCPTELLWTTTDEIQVRDEADEWRFVADGDVS